MRYPFIIFLVFTLYACGKSTNISNIPMSTPSGEGPFQIITYDEQRVEREVVSLEEGNVISQAKAVYVDINGRFVFIDGSPIKSYLGEDLYWNNQGIILSDAGRIVDKEEVFTLASKPMKNHEPMMYLDNLRRGRANARMSNE